VTPAELAAAGPRAAKRRAAVRDAVGAVYDGYERHYGEPQALEAADRDLALLDGDRRYADGLAGLAELGDLTAIAELADVIALCAQAQCEGDEELAAAVWTAGAVAIGWGETPDLVGAKVRARTGEDSAAEALRRAALEAAGDAAAQR
jgi:hypothetical protein